MVAKVEIDSGHGAGVTAYRAQYEEQLRNTEVRTEPVPADAPLVSVQPRCPGEGILQQHHAEVALISLTHFHTGFGMHL